MIDAVTTVNISEIGRLYNRIKSYFAIQCLWAENDRLSKIWKDNGLSFQNRSFSQIQIFSYYLLLDHDLFTQTFKIQLMHLP